VSGSERDKRFDLREALLQIINSLSLSLYSARYRSRFCNFQPLQLNNGERQREVVLMEAASEKALQRTHRRYFEHLSELVKAS